MVPHDTVRKQLRCAGLDWTALDSANRHSCIGLSEHQSVHLSLRLPAALGCSVLTCTVWCSDRVRGGRTRGTKGLKGEVVNLDQNDGFKSPSLPPSPLPVTVTVISRVSLMKIATESTVQQQCITVLQNTVHHC